jgi:hypothetical protein
VDDAVGAGGGGPQHVEVLDGASHHPDPDPVQGGGGLIRPGQADDRVPVGEQVLNDSGSDEAGRAGHENVHDRNPLQCGNPATRGHRVVSGR